MAMDFRRVLDLLSEHLEVQGHRWLMVGGLAMQVHGLARTTQDLDIVTSAGARGEIVKLLESLGYETLHQSEGFSNHLHAEGSLGRVDVIYVDESTAERMLAKGRIVPWLGRDLLVPAPEHLIAMKVHAIKNDPSRTFAEMADIQHLLGLPGSDHENVRHYFEAAGLMDLFDELIRLS